MLIHLYESVINEDDTRSIGRIVGEVKCIGDGTPGEIRFFNTCDEIWDIRNVNNINYGKNSNKCSTNLFS